MQYFQATKVYCFYLLLIAPHLLPHLKAQEQVFLTELSDSHFAAVSEEKMNYDTELFELLRVLRKNLADKMGIPPYIVFSDDSLVEMAIYLPCDEKNFSLIKGVGEQKLHQYGNIFIEHIRKYCQAKGLKPKNIFRKSRKLKSSKSDTVRYSIDLFKQGLSITQIAQKRSLVESTIYGHIEKAYLAGEDLDISRLVDSQREKVIRKSFLEFGLDYPLSSIKEKLGEKYLYEELRLVRAMLRRELGEGK